MLANRSSGRPLKGEFADYAQADVDSVDGDDAVAALVRQRPQTVELFEEFGDEGGSLTYGPGKWTIRQVLGHLADDERIYAYRALCIARADARPLPGFDEKAYAETGSFDSRPMLELLADYEAVRNASVTLFLGLDSEAWLRRGVANGHEVTPRGLAFHIAGHELHHHRIVRERYLPLLGAGPSGSSRSEELAAEPPPKRWRHPCA
jgi:uncharacterized damage-inducible protein DinB